MSNQDSEVLDDILRNLSWAQHELGAKGLIPLSKHEYEAKAKIESIIRTEKLKLLAEVRERVVGTKDLKLSDIYGNDWRNNYGYTEVQVRDAANHLQRKQLNSLTKLEAEL